MVLILRRIHKRFCAQFKNYLSALSSTRYEANVNLYSIIRNNIAKQYLEVSL